LTDEREGLVAVETAKLDDLAVEREATGGESRFAETDAAGVIIDKHAVAGQTDFDVVEVRVLEIPKLDASEAGKSDGVPGGILRSLSTGVRGSRGVGVHLGVGSGSLVRAPVLLAFPMTVSPSISSTSMARLSAGLPARKTSTSSDGADDRTFFGWA